MLLSLWIIRDELGELCSQACLAEGAMTIKGFRILSGGDAVEPDYLHICRDDGFLGAGKDATLLVHRHEYLVVEAVPFEKVVNIVISIFEKFNSWGRRMREAMHDSDAFRKIMDIAHEYFKCPMFFGHKNRRLYAVTDQYTDKDVYEGWDLFKNAMAVTKEGYSKISGSVKPVDKNRIWADIDFKERPGYKVRTPLRVNIHHRGELWGHFVLYRYEDDVSPTVHQAAEFVAGIYSELVAAMKHKTGASYLEIAWIADALRGKQLSAAQTSALKAFLYLEDGRRAVLYLLVPKTDTYDDTKEWFADYFQTFPNFRAFILGDNIVIIESQQEGDPLIGVDRIRTLLMRSKYRCGVSLPFKDTGMLEDVYKQAQYAVRLSRDGEKDICFFRDIAYCALTQELKRMPRWRGWIIPELIELIGSDDGGEYFRTLTEFLQNNGNLSEAAKKLYIHRNSLIYRIKKLEDLLGMSLDDTMAREYLSLCCHMLCDCAPALDPENSRENSQT